MRLDEDQRNEKANKGQKEEQGQTRIGERGKCFQGAPLPVHVPRARHGSHETRNAEATTSLLKQHCNLQRRGEVHASQGSGK